jgi:Fungal specific transcription factor domain
MSEDLGLHLNSSTWVDVPDHVKDTRRRVWGVVCIVDLLISLPLGHPPSILDPQWASEIPISPPPPPDAGLPGSLETYSTPTPHYFAYTASLCLIISRINFQLYLCGNTTEAEKLEKLHSLRAELDAWHACLPAALRISVDNTAPLPVLDVNLLYHAALILLYRPLYVNFLSFLHPISFPCSSLSSCYLVDQTLIFPQFEYLLMQHQLSMFCYRPTAPSSVTTVLIHISYI